MKTENKTHYRKVFKSDHLGVADLEDMMESNIQMIFTISHVKQEYGVMVAGRKGDHNIAYFKENIKPLVLNATNSKVVKSFCEKSPFVDDWNNVLIQLYIDPSAKLKGEIVGGVRISPQQPRAQKSALTKSNKAVWDRAVAAYKRDGNLVQVLDRYSITKENQTLIIEQANAVS
jgi:hypothetical protein